MFRNKKTKTDPRDLCKQRVKRRLKKLTEALANVDEEIADAKKDLKVAKKDRAFLRDFIKRHRWHRLELQNELLRLQNELEDLTAGRK